MRSKFEGISEFKAVKMSVTIINWVLVLRAMVILLTMLVSLSGPFSIASHILLNAVDNCCRFNSNDLPAVLSGTISGGQFSFSTES